MLEHATIIALLVLSLWYTLQDGEIFGGIGNWMYKVFPKKMHPPLFECNVCCTPWYGSALYWLIPWQQIGLPQSTLIGWPVTIIAAMGIQVVINKLSPDKEAPNLTDKVEEIESRLDANGIFK